MQTKIIAFMNEGLYKVKTWKVNIGKGDHNNKINSQK